jgi:hypothetical protein
MRKTPPFPVPNLRLRRGRWFWEPPRGLRGAFRAVPLGDDADVARAEARRLNAGMEKQRRLIRPAAPLRRDQPLSLGEIAGAFMASADFAGLAPRTRAQYRYELGRLCRDFGHAPAETLSPVDVDDWRDRLIHAAPETLRHVATRGHQLYVWARRKKKVARADNPFADLRLPGGGKRAFVFAFSDVRLLAEAAARMGRPSIGAALALAFLSIQRITDVWALQRRHVVDGPDGRSLRFAQGKTGFQVDMAWPDEVEAFLPEGWARAAPDAPLIPREEDGAAWNEKTASRVFSRVLAATVAAHPRLAERFAGGQLRDGRRSGFVHAYVQGQQMTPPVDIPEICSMSGHSLDEGYAIIEHYLPKTRAFADRARAAMKRGLG